MRQRYLPGAAELRTPEQSVYAYGYGSPAVRVASHWLPLIEVADDKARFASLAAAVPPMCRGSMRSLLMNDADDVSG